MRKCEALHITRAKARVVRRQLAAPARRAPPAPASAFSSSHPLRALRHGLRRAVWPAHLHSRLAGRRAPRPLQASIIWAWALYVMKPSYRDNDTVHTFHELLQRYKALPTGVEAEGGTTMHPACAHRSSYDSNTDSPGAAASIEHVSSRMIQRALTNSPTSRRHAVAASSISTSHPSTCALPCLRCTQSYACIEHSLPECSTALPARYAVTAHSPRVAARPLAIQSAAPCASHTRRSPPRHESVSSIERVLPSASS